MTAQEKIEAMAVLGCVRNPRAHTAEECSKCGFKQGMCNAYRHAEALYNAGYRTEATLTYDFIKMAQKHAVQEFAEGLKAKLFRIFGTSCDNLDSIRDITDVINNFLEEEQT